MVGIYFSGTGNTKHCVETLTGLVDGSARVLALESGGAVQAIRESGTVILGYPVQFSNLPVLVRDFITGHPELWRGKRVLCVATMGAFSGDGAGCAARLLGRYGAVILGGLHVKMPDSVCDSRLLKKSLAQNREIVARADRRLAQAAEEIREGKYPRDGLSPLAHAAGLLGQRLWFYGKTAGYTDKLKISGACVGCGQCAALCPTGNITLVEGRAAAGDRCTMCYRCVSQCPQRAITLLGRAVREQCRFENYR